jgi:ABC-type uncharacterized transport system ATPase component
MSPLFVGVNGAGKTTSFSMLTGETGVLCHIHSQLVCSVLLSSCNRFAHVGLLDVLSGDLAITHGQAYVAGYSINTQLNMVHQRMGYALCVCPLFLLLHR